MKRFHVSKNLCDEDYTGISDTITYKPLYVGNGDYTLSSSIPNGESGVKNLFLLAGNASSGASSASNGVALNISRTVTAIDGYVTIAFRLRADGAPYSPANYDTMLNTGSTALPYEPYGDTWQTKSPPRYGTATDAVTTLPADLYADGNNATVGLVGNMVQSGTPTPSSPIQPQETGERTGNLYFKSLAGCSIDATGKLTGNSQFMCYVAKVEANKTYIGEKGYVYAFFDTEPVSGSQSYNSQRVTENARDGITSPINGYVVVRFNTGTTDAMLSEGTTILPYEPYGYKIPISSASTTTPVYLGEVESTRQIKELVLSSSQNWQLQSINSHGIANFYITLINDFLNNTSVISNYFTRQTTTIADTTTEGMLIALSTNTATVYIRINSQTASTAQEFKNWLDGLSEEVAIWYVLATEETAVVNEPLRKIGDYADTVSGITIPTITGKDTFDVQTTLKPSEVSLSYTGWHDATVKEWDGSEWQ